MSKKERALPKPGKTPFSKKRSEDKGQEDLLMADEMALAAAEGKLDEYIEQEIPEGEYAKKLAMMMLGMTGALPPEGGRPAAGGDRGSSTESDETAHAEESVPGAHIPLDILNAVHAGDVEKLKELLVREHQRRTPGVVEASGGEREVQQKPQAEASVEKDMLDALIKIASENNITIDWLVARALKLYLDEYRRSGRL